MRSTSFTPATLRNVSSFSCFCVACHCSFRALLRLIAWLVLCAAGLMRVICSKTAQNTLLKGHISCVPRLFAFSQLKSRISACSQRIERAGHANEPRRSSRVGQRRADFAPRQRCQRRKCALLLRKSLTCGSFIGNASFSGDCLANHDGRGRQARGSRRTAGQQEQQHQLHDRAQCQERARLQPRFTLRNLPVSQRLSADYTRIRWHPTDKTIALLTPTAFEIWQLEVRFWFRFPPCLFDTTPCVSCSQPNDSLAAGSVASGGEQQRRCQAVHARRR